MTESDAILLSATGDSITVSGPNDVDTVLPVAVWQLTDGRRVVIVGEGGPLELPEIDGAAVVGAVRLRWPDALVLERRPVPASATGDPRGYEARYRELAEDGSRTVPDFAALGTVGLRLSHA